MLAEHVHSLALPPVVAAAHRQLLRDVALILLEAWGKPNGYGALAAARVVPWTH